LPAYVKLGCNRHGKLICLRALELVLYQHCADAALGDHAAQTSETVLGGVQRCAEMRKL